ncbi:hypothetical protein SU69_01265 [Thermosipho melanesiensis]|uniref:Uncharacterized protein n=2 Tax=Thermosipho melanesiensis TaxID=46541 RepID=A6LJL1_THEM4|nr:hypothetical protein [Thermosipho melanesiensis]ABR30112.1 hypothetical protein Tmel_0238 [Thermosipho melanesiensis BI429]APT73309.1 hypothetical protein BW47_01305 [Thermosipho melanesiensis]OOC38700.1 hypothetical protein SU68_01265 [Thermosipho melanesiensis]OOC40504.1 hypothetical protein SU70_01265 [Thermosipho melanesiensis]OOC40769.1 hypothetical protein SU69_01265 [Thermosipho melanesiensis]
MKKLLVIFIVLFSIFTFAEIYSIKIGDTLLGTSVLFENNNIFTTKTEIDYGVLYTIDSTTVFNENLFENYTVSFTVDGSYTGQIVGNYDGKVANFVFETLQSSYTYSLNSRDLIILDNNFVLSHLKRLLEFPAPYFKVVVPQLLFNPSKTGYAVGEATLKKKGDTFELVFRNERIRIKYKEGKILEIEYPGYVTVELID